MNPWHGFRLPRGAQHLGGSGWDKPTEVLVWVWSSDPTIVCRPTYWPDSVEFHGHSLWVYSVEQSATRLICYQCFRKTTGLAVHGRWAKEIKNKIVGLRSKNTVFAFIWRTYVAKRRREDWAACAHIQGWSAVPSRPRSTSNYCKWLQSLQEATRVGSSYDWQQNSLQTDNMTARVARETLRVSELRHFPSHGTK